MSFTFPDPSVATSIVHPTTGVEYNYQDGMWIPVSDDATSSDLTANTAVDIRQDVEIDNLQSGETIDRQLLVTLSNRVGTAETDIDNLEGLDLNNALSALAIAQQDIINLKAKVNTLELTSFLILE